MDKKVEYAVTSLAFNESKNILATSSYSTNVVEIFKVENDFLKSENIINLKGENNPLNTLFFLDDFLVCVDDFSKQISKIDYKTNQYIASFKHEHSRGFECLDFLNTVDNLNDNLFIVGSKKIHPPTAEKLGLDHKTLHNIFLLDGDLNAIFSASIPGNVIQTKFNKYDKTITVLSRYLNGTTLYVLDFNLNILNELYLSDKKAVAAYIAISHIKIYIVLQIKTEGVYSEYIELNSKNLNLIQNQCYEDSKFLKKIKGYTNSIFLNGDTLIVEHYCRDKDKSDLIFYSTKNEEMIKNTVTFGFMESIAFNSKLIAWGENNKIKVINI